MVFELYFSDRVRSSAALIGRCPHLLVRFLGGVMNMSLECGGCTRLCDGRRPGSTPGEDTLLILAPEPDGKATACKTVSSGFDSHRRL